MSYRISHKESIQINESNTCTAKSCLEHRDGYSRYCTKHKEHYRCYGSIYQNPIKDFKKEVNEIRLEVAKTIKKLLNEDHEIADIIKRDKQYLSEVIRSPRTTLNPVDIKEHIKEGLGLRKSSMKLTDKTYEIIEKDYHRSSIFILSVVIATFIYQYRYPARLMTGRPLYMYVFKAFMLGTKLVPRLNQYGQKRYHKRKIAYHQGLLIGAILGSRLSKSVNYFLEIERLERKKQEERIEEILKDII